MRHIDINDLEVGMEVEVRFLAGTNDPFAVHVAHPESLRAAEVIRILDGDSEATMPSSAVATVVYKGDAPERVSHGCPAQSAFMTPILVKVLGSQSELDAFTFPVYITQLFALKPVAGGYTITLGVDVPDERHNIKLNERDCHKIAQLVQTYLWRVRNPANRPFSEADTIRTVDVVDYHSGCQVAFAEIDDD